MSGGIMMTVSRILIFLILFAMASTVITAIIWAVQNHRAAGPVENGNISNEIISTLSTGFGAIQNRVRSTFGYPTANASGVQTSSGVVGHAVGGVNPPSVAERIAALLLADAGRHRVTLGQEILMTGASAESESMNPHSCLGADSEILLELRNDIGADQLDVSYAFEDLTTAAGSNPSSPIIAARVVKVASCGRASTIRQCIPVAPAGRGVRLHTLAYYYDPATSTEEHLATDGNGMVSIPAKHTPSALREEPRVYGTLLDTATLKSNPTFELLASAFVVSPILA